MNTLVVDVGGTNVKVWRTGAGDKVKIPSGKKMTAERFAADVKDVVEDWEFHRVSLGYPGDVLNGKPVTEPLNLGPGWVDFDFAAVFGCPVRIMNDACMQALGSYEGGRMLYLGLGTSLGSTYIIDGKIVPLALGDLPFLRGQTFEHFMSRQGLQIYGAKKWQQSVARAAAILKTAFMADYVVLGGGNAKKIRKMPDGCRRGMNQSAYFGGIRMWDDAHYPAIAAHTLPLNAIPQAIPAS